ncbi:MAG TPA: HAD hydrolase-like protein [Candidatus Omnitrophota bacterium]|nr:HAD hydrolase-like protein [Candidatus Omnitrophota bacterium]
MKHAIHPKNKILSTPSEKLKVDAIIFDIDNVLVDTRHSYLEAIRNTVELYLTHGPVPFFSRSIGGKFPNLLSPEDVDRFKLLGGFNDDWDCCYGLLIYLLSLPVAKRTVEALKKAVDIEKFSKTVKDRPLRVAGITALFGRPTTITIERVARIFQEVYLGKDIFPRLTQNKMRYWKKRGLIHREKLVFKKPLLQKLKNHGYKLGIATGRSYYEASYALKSFEITDLFDAMTTMDDVKKEEREKKESLRKPHPFSLIKTAQALGVKKKFLYVGDLPDDILAANRAKNTISISSVAFPMLASDPFHALKAIETIKPDHIMKTPADLCKLLDIK